MWRICPHVAQVRFWRPKRPHLEKGHVVWQSSPSWDKKLRTQQKYFFTFYGSKGGALGQKNGAFGCWAGCEVADLKQRQGIGTMDHIGKIQSLVLPTYGPEDAPVCKCEYGPCACEYGRMCHTADRSEVWGFHPTQAAFSLPGAARITKLYTSCEIWPIARNRGRHPGGT